jgi:ATP-binding cassette subfamily F protein 3
MVSHDRYFVERLATKIIEIGHGEASVYPGRYDEFLWSKEQGEKASTPSPQRPTTKPPAARAQTVTGPTARADVHKGGSKPAASREERKRLEVDRRKKQRAAEALQKRIADLEARIADRETQVKELEATMAAPGFYENHDTSKPVIDRHQALMWEVGDLMAQWEALQEHAAASET